MEGMGERIQGVSLSTVASFLAQWYQHSGHLPLGWANGGVGCRTSTQQEETAQCRPKQKQKKWIGLQMTHRTSKKTEAPDLDRKQLFFNKVSIGVAEEASSERLHHGEELCRRHQRVAISEDPSGRLCYGDGIKEAASQRRASRIRQEGIGRTATERRH